MCKKNTNYCEKVDFRGQTSGVKMVDLGRYMWRKTLERLYRIKWLTLQ
jgi:hypothetical protein